MKVSDPPSLRVSPGARSPAVSGASISGPHRPLAMPGDQGRPTLSVPHADREQNDDALSDLAIASLPAEHESDLADRPPQGAVPDAVAAPAALDPAWLMAAGMAAGFGVGAGEQVREVRQVPAGDAPPSWLKSQATVLLPMLSALSASALLGARPAVTPASVGPDNLPPLAAATLGSQTVVEGETLIPFGLDPTAFTDPEGGRMSWAYRTEREGQAVTLDWLSFDAETLSFAGTPPPASRGVYTIHVEVTDAKGAKASSAFLLDIQYRPTVFDGYLKHALVFRDVDQNGAWTHEPVTDVTFANLRGDLRVVDLDWIDVDGDGRFTAEPWALTNSVGRSAPIGGQGVLRATAWDLTSGIVTTDISTGQVFEGVISAPEGTEVLSPLTSLVLAALGDELTAQDPDAVRAAADRVLRLVLGPDIAGIDLLSLDPVRQAATTSDPQAQALALQVQTAGLQIANLFRIAVSLAASSGISDLSAVTHAVAWTLLPPPSPLAALRVQSVASERVDLADPSLLARALSDVVAQVPDARTRAVLETRTGEIAQALVQVNERITTEAERVRTQAEGGDAIDFVGALTEATALQIVAQQSIASRASNVALLASIDPALAAQAQSFDLDLDRELLSTRAQVATIMPVLAGAPEPRALPDALRLSLKAGDLRVATQSGDLLGNDLIPESLGLAELAAARPLDGAGPASSWVEFVEGTSTLVLQGRFGQLSLDRAGRYQYTAAADAYQRIVAASTDPTERWAEDTFAYRLRFPQAADSSATTTAALIRVALDAANSLPTVGAVQLDAWEPGQGVAGTPVLRIDLAARALDPDGDPLQVTEVRPASLSASGSADEWRAAYGTLRRVSVGGIPSATLFDYELDPALTDALSSGQTVRDRFSFRISDGVGPETVLSGLAIDIRGADDTPRLVSPLPDIGILVGQPLAYRIPQGVMVDPEGVALQFALERVQDGQARPLPGWLGFDPVTMTLTGIPAAGDAGILELRLIASDGRHSTVDPWSLTVGTVNQAPTAAAWLDSIDSLSESVSTKGRIRLAQLVITDDAIGIESIDLEGADASLFEIDGVTLYLRAGVSLDVETRSSYALTARVSDPTVVEAEPLRLDFRLALIDANDHRPAFQSLPATIAWPAGPVQEGVPIYRPLVTDADATPEHRELRFSLLGPDAALFRIDPQSGVLSLRAGIADQPPRPYQVSVLAANMTSPHGSVEQALSLATRPIAITSIGSVTDEESIGTAGKVVARIEGEPVSGLIAQLSGPDAGSFRLDADGQLVFAPGPARLDRDARAVYQVQIDWYGPADPAQPIASRPFSLPVLERPAPILRVNSLAGDGRLDAAELLHPLDQSWPALITGEAPPAAAIYVVWTDTQGRWIPALRTASVIADARGQWSFSLPQLLGERDAGTLTPIADGAYGLRFFALDDHGQLLAQTQAELEVSAAPSLELIEQSGALRLEGTADGRLLIEVDAEGHARLSRFGTYSAELVRSDRVITDLFERRIEGVSELELAITVPDASKARVYRIDAPDLTSLVLRGASGPGVDHFLLKITDPDPAGLDVRQLRLRSSELEASGDRLSFVFEPSARNRSDDAFDDDRLRLSADTFLSDDFSLLESLNGTVDASAIDPSAGGYFPMDRPWVVGQGSAVWPPSAMIQAVEPPPAGI